MKHCSFTDIGQFRNVVRAITDRTRYVGRDENGDAIYDNKIALPVIKFKGTCKCHGTNFGVTKRKHGEMYAQSRENIVTVGKDNAGSALFLEKNEEVFKKFFDTIDFGDYDYVTIFGEFCGKGIQKGVAISELEKMFVIFNVKFSYDTIEQGDNVYSEPEFISKFRSPENRIFNIYDFETFEIDVDMNNPEFAQNKIVELTLAVEAECPVGKHFGVSGVGEGIVWVTKHKDCTYMFKSKGQAHSVSKVKTIASVDVEKIESINEFVEYAVTENRLEQGYGIICKDGYDIKKIADFLRWVVNDITKEELDTMIQNNLEPKDVNSKISNKARMWFFNKEF